MQTHTKWEAVSRDDNMGPYKIIRFRNNEGFEAEYAIDYRSLHTPYYEFPVNFILKTLERYDTWRNEREDRKSE